MNIRCFKSGDIRSTITSTEDFKTFDVEFLEDIADPLNFMEELPLFMNV